LSRADRSASLKEWGRVKGFVGMSGVDGGVAAGVVPVCGRATIPEPGSTLAGGQPRRGLGLDAGEERRILVVQDRASELLGSVGVRFNAPWSSLSEGGSGWAAGHPFAGHAASMVRSGHDQTGSSS
jgi:hypothetical protein